MSPLLVSLDILAYNIGYLIHDHHVMGTKTGAVAMVANHYIGSVVERSPRMREVGVRSLVLVTLCRMFGIGRVRTGLLDIGIM